MALGYTPYDTHGRGSSALVVMGLVHNGAHPLTARIPYRCFLPEGLEGVLVGGKSLSATRDASSLCRMNADVENAGYALGLAAAMAVRERRLPSRIDVKALRGRLIQADCLTEAEPARSITAAMAAREMEAGSEGALAHCILQDASEMLPLLRQIDIFKEMGMGGFHMHSRSGMATPYLSDEFMNLTRACRDEAEKNHMLCWLYDEDRWPSGAAGGLVTRDRRYAARYLLFTPTPYGQGEKSTVTTSQSVGARQENGTLLAQYRVTLKDGCLAHY